VGFSAAACPAAKIGSAEFGHETILAHLLGTGPLWEELRVKRGAYGASVWTDGLEGLACFSSYRDPRPVDSLSFFGEALETLERRFASGTAEAEAEVDEAAIGSLGREQKPLLPEEKGFVDFRRSLYGISNELRQSKRDAMLAAGSRDLAAAAGRLASSYASSAEAVVISRSEDTEKFKEAYPSASSRSLPL
jgi:Zn-dependent M16 (insulinase) family peptidase